MMVVVGVNMQEMASTPTKIQANDTRAWEKSAFPALPHFRRMVTLWILQPAVAHPASGFHCQGRLQCPPSVYTAPNFLGE